MQGNKSLMVIGGMIFLLLILGGGYFFLRGGSTPSTPPSSPVSTPPGITPAPEVDGEEPESFPPSPQPVPPLTPQVKEFNVSASRFTFEPGIITVNRGDTVRLHITSSDVTHGFAISEFDVNAVLPPGETKTVEFVASQSGTFRMFCSFVCGSGHANMRGTLIVR